jgi:hypothetical protein
MPKAISLPPSVPFRKECPDARHISLHLRIAIKTLTNCRKPIPMTHGATSPEPRGLNNEIFFRQ